MSNLKNRLVAKAAAAQEAGEGTDITVTQATEVAPEHVGSEGVVTPTEGTAVSGTAPGYEATTARVEMIGDIKVVSL